MLSPLRFSFTVAATLVALGACGYPDFEFGPSGGPASTADASSVAVTSSTAGGGGAGGADVASSSSSSSSTSSTGVGGAGACNFGESKGCQPGEKCGVVNASTGETKCISAGSNKAWQSCVYDKDCEAKTVCDFYLGVCKPICAEEKDCHFDAKKGNTTFKTTGTCIALRDASGVALDPANAKLRHCTSDCELTTASPCDTTKSSTCVEVGVESGLFDCARSSNKLAGTSCQRAADCRWGMLCVDTGQGGGACTPWCDQPNTPKATSCPSDRSFCYALEKPPKYSINGTPIEYGACGFPP